MLQILNWFVPPPFLFCICVGTSSLFLPLCSEITPDSTQGPYVVLEVLPGSVACKGSIFTLVISLQTVPSHYLEILTCSYFIPHRVAVDVWSVLADFCNILTAVNQSEVPLYKDADDDLTLLTLEEDRLLSGFVPLLAAPQDPCYVEKTSDKVSSRPNISLHSPLLLSLQTFLFLGSFLCKRNMIKSLRRVLRENIDLLAVDIQLCVLKKKKALSTSFGVCVCARWHVVYTIISSLV